MGGGNRRGDDTLVINSTNVFAALGSLRKKKKPDKALGASKKAVKGTEPRVFWAPAPLTSKSWADVEDEDDDDFYANTAPPQSAWGPVDPPKPEESLTPVEESENEGSFNEVDEDGEEDHEPGSEVPVEREPVAERPPEATFVPKDTERQLSKKELKKKGLEELDAVLAEFGYLKMDASRQDESDENRGVTQNGEVEKKENAPGDGKNAKKKKKKKNDKASKEAGESHDQGDAAREGNGPDEAVGPGKESDVSSGIDIKERLKKLAAAKKKRVGKEMDSAARAAAHEASLRSAKLAAVKKEKIHYNQQPVR